ncbi:hypothetical protein ACFY9C_35035 [Streptomyces filamentosus]|uniref:hypothetical protein n=1 Tax=Streptomyces filamentosus TaxID=67294 RepID=UPI0036F18462
MTTLLPQPPGSALWTPGQDPRLLGCIPVLGGLHVTALTAPDVGEGAHPALFLLPGHHRWATTIQAAALYMQHVHTWRHWSLYPGDDPDDVIPRIPRAVHTHATLHCHPDHTWTLTWTHPHTSGSTPVTAMRHPAAPLDDVSIPHPDRAHGAPATWAL